MMSLQHERATGSWSNIDLNSEDSLHACLVHSEVETNGPPSRPIEFPTPIVRYCEVAANVRAMDHRSRKIHSLRNVIVPCYDEGGGGSVSTPTSYMRQQQQMQQQMQFAYMPKKKIAKSAYGSVRLCIVLKRRPNAAVARSSNSSTATVSTAASSTSAGSRANDHRRRSSGEYKSQTYKDDLEDYYSTNNMNDDDGEKRINEIDDAEKADNEAAAEEDDRFDDECSEDAVEWESTERMVIIKASAWSKVCELRGQHLEDPIKEIAALQYLGNYHPHVAGTYECMQDEDFLYTVMPYYVGQDLFGSLQQKTKRKGSIAQLKAFTNDENESPKNNKSKNDSSSSTVKCPTNNPLAQKGGGLDERQVRKWFREILLGLFHLQKKGVCHRDICLENILLNEMDQAVIVDFGLCLRVPFTDINNCGHVSDASSGPYRRVMKSQGQCGTLLYAAPEIVDGKSYFDGFAVDLWAGGVVLFVLLVGMAPFKWAHPSDKRFLKIAKGGLRDLLQSLDINISDDACHLLQGMLWRNPNRRFTLAEVMQHPWVTGANEEQQQHQAQQAQQLQQQAQKMQQQHKQIIADVVNSQRMKLSSKIHRMAEQFHAPSKTDFYFPQPNAMHSFTKPPKPTSMLSMTTNPTTPLPPRMAQI